MIAPTKKRQNFKIGTIMKEYINEVAWGKIFNFLKKQKNIYIIKEM